MLTCVAGATSHGLSCPLEGERIELIGGALRIRHDGAGGTVLADLAWVRVQGSFAADELSEPEPDFCVFPLGDYDAAHPSEAHLIVEVSDSSLAYDLGEKARLYAACGVPEYWVVNLVDRVVEVHRGPGATGYREVTAVPKGARLRLLTFPEVELAVDDFLR
jgi:Uma2 family endonuclease